MDKIMHFANVILEDGIEIWMQEYTINSKYKNKIFWELWFDQYNPKKSLKISFITDNLIIKLPIIVISDNYTLNNDTLNNNTLNNNTSPLLDMNPIINLQKNKKQNNDEQKYESLILPNIGKINFFLTLQILLKVETFTNNFAYIIQI